jgi:hypothetical protein
MLWQNFFWTSSLGLYAQVTNCTCHIIRTVQEKNTMHFCCRSYLPLPPASDRVYTVKKRFASFPSPAGMSLTTELSLGGNNDVITELFLPRGSLVRDIPAGDGKLVNLFLRCTWLCSCCTECRNTKREKRGSNCSCVSWNGEGDVGPYLRRQKKMPRVIPLRRVWNMYGWGALARPQLKKCIKCPSTIKRLRCTLWLYSGTRLLIIIKSAVFLAHTYKRALKVHCVKKLVWEKRSNYKSTYKKFPC